MTQNRIRNALMDGAIKVVARDGLEKITTRSIASECDLHDAYIYRYFIDKDDLLMRTFIREDKAMTARIKENLEKSDLKGKSIEEVLRTIVMPIWEFLMENEDVCKFYVRYYYSIHFEKDAIEEFREDNRTLRGTFEDLFPQGADLELMFHYHMDTLLNIAMKVTTDEIEKTPDIGERVFKLLYSVTKVFLKTA